MPGGHRRLVLLTAVALGLASLSGCGSSHAPVATTTAAPRAPAAGQGTLSAELRRALPAFARAPTAADAWTRDPSAFGGVRAGRLVATLGQLRLYLLATGTSGTCLELPGYTGDCNDAPDFFGGSPVELLEAGPAVGAVLAPAVARVRLETPTGAVPVPLDADRAVLFLCPHGSCAGDRLVGIGRNGRQLFGLAL